MKMQLDENDRNAISEMILTHFWGYITTGHLPTQFWADQAQKYIKKINLIIKLN